MTVLPTAPLSLLSRVVDGYSLGHSPEFVRAAVREISLNQRIALHDRQLVHDEFVCIAVRSDPLEVSDRLEHPHLLLREPEKEGLVSRLRCPWSAQAIPRSDAWREYRILIRFTGGTQLMRRLLRLLRRKARMSSDPDPVALADVLKQCPGLWVAIDRETNEARAAAESPYLLAQKIREKQLRNVAVVRAPDPSEPELVGLG